MTVPEPDEGKTAAGTRLRFDRYLLDLNRGALSLDGSEITLRPKTFSVLQYLVENSGRLVPKEAIFSAVWPRIAVTDDVLVQSIGELRRALGDDGARLIKTIPRRGYRLDAIVTIIAAEDSKAVAPSVSASPNSEPSDPDITTTSPIEPVTRTRPRWLVLACAAAIAVGALVLFTSLHGVQANRPFQVDARATKASIAVLPFVSQGADSGGRDYFTDGVTQDIIAALGRFSALTVMSWNSVSEFKTQRPTPTDIASRLSVRYQVEGNVQQSADRIRVNVQLVNQDGQVLWSERFDEALGDVFTLQDKITKRIVGALAVHVTDSEQKRVYAKPTQSLEAYDLVLRARPALQRPDRSNIAAARSLLRQAINVDPTYASAYGALADTYHTDVAMGWSQSPAVSLERAEKAATKALSIDETEVRARVVLGRIHLFHQEYEQAQAEIDRAIAINPNDAYGLAGRGNILMWTGHTDAAIEALEAAKRIDPELNAIDRNALSLAYYLKHRYADAVDQAQQNLRQTESARFNYMVLVASLAQQGRTADTVRVVGEMQKVYPLVDARSFGSKFMNPVDLEHLRDGLQKAGLSTFEP